MFVTTRCKDAKGGIKNTEQGNEKHQAGGKTVRIEMNKACVELNLQIVYFSTPSIIVGNYLVNYHGILLLEW